MSNTQNESLEVVELTELANVTGGEANGEARQLGERAVDRQFFRPQGYPTWANARPYYRPCPCDSSGQAWPNQVYWRPWW